MAVLAVDPSSRRSGGALLGDRARIERDPADREVFIRSTAAGERLGGLAPATRAAASALAAAFDVVVIETVGVGQSETEVADVADTVAVVVQPGSGDVLQFLKSGIMEIPDVLVVTKADLGQVAVRALGDLRAALRSLGSATPRCSPSPRSRRPAGSTSSSMRSTRHRAASTCPPGGCAAAGCTRWPTSSPSTASAGCGRSAAGARPSAGWPSRPRALDVATSHGRSRRRPGERSPSPPAPIRCPASRWSTARPRCGRGATATCRRWSTACQDPEIARWTRVPANYGETDAAPTCCSATT